MKKKSTKLNKNYYFFYPGNINTKTGGYIYEKNILQRAKALNFNLKAIRLSENYPFQKKNDISTLKNILNKLPISASSLYAKNIFSPKRN